MKLNRSILLPILVLLAVVALGYGLTRSNDDEEPKEDQTQVYIQDVNPQNSPPPRDVVEAPVKEEVKPTVGGATTPTDPGKVLGQVDEKPRTGTSAPAPRTPAPVPNTVRYSSIGLEVAMPTSWQVRTEQTNRGNLIVFYSPSAVFGTIEVATGYQSLQQFENELRADYRVSSVSWTNFNGHSALMYYTSETPGVHYALYINGRLYVINGNTLIDSFSRLRFF
jgi:hypothetical protein